MAQRFRVRLIATTALAGMAPAAALAQAFQGNASSANATVSFEGTTDTITVGTGGLGNTAVINWSPFDISGNGAINFLPAGSVANFINDGSIGNYTVINRILPIDPTRPVQLNGLVNATVNASPGGTVLFYSPGGIVAGATSRFDVGSLVLTTLDPTQLAEGSFRFTGAEGSGSQVIVNSGAILTARATGGYVALVAPRVVMSGTVRVDGTAAYVAAESVDINISTGLYDISFTAGTETGSPANANPNAIVHDGQTVVRGDSSVAQRVVMAAVAKNDAITMLVGGSVAGSQIENVYVDGSDIVLSSGVPGAAGGGAIKVATGAQVNADQSADLIVSADGLVLPLIAEAQRLAQISLIGRPAPVTYRNVRLLGRQSTVVEIQSAGQIGDLTIEGNLIVDGGGIGGSRTAGLFVGTGAALQVQGDLTVDLTARGMSGPGANAVGGTITASVDSGGTLIAGNLRLLADGIGYDTGDTVPGGSGTGGSVGLTLVGANVSVTGELLLRADGLGYGNDPGGVGGGGYGGAAVFSSDSSALDFNALTLSARATSAGAADQGPFPSGRGGTASAIITGGGVTATTVALVADFTGTGSRGRGGIAGDASLNVLGGAFMSVADSLAITADATGGFGGGVDGGAANAGNANLTIDGSALLLTSRPSSALPLVQVTADAVGGAAGSAVLDGNGGAAAGGSATILVTAGGLFGGSPSDNVSPEVTLSATGTGGDGNTVGGNGGTGSGGLAQLQISTPTGSPQTSHVGLDELLITANASGGIGGGSNFGNVAGAGGAAFAGTARLSADGDMTILTDGSSSTLQLSAVAFGATGGGISTGEGPGLGGLAGAGGDAIGGTVDFIVASGATVQAYDGNLFGTVSVRALAGATAGVGGSAFDNPDGPGAGGGAGGSAFGGAVTFGISGSLREGNAAGTDLLDLAINVSALGGGGGLGGGGASGGGIGGNGGIGGDAQFGSVAILLDGTGEIRSTRLLGVVAGAVAGAGGNASLGGTPAVGGATSVDPDAETFTLGVADQATLSIDRLEVQANSRGGDGGTSVAKGGIDQPAADGARGGAAIGADFVISLGPSATLEAGDLTLRGIAQGGAGGAGFAGISDISASDGGTGGAATGGRLDMLVEGGYTGFGLIAEMPAIGGNGGTGGTLAFDGSLGAVGGNGGSGGDATGGRLDIRLADTTVLVNSFGIDARATATTGAGGNGGTPPAETDPVFVNAVEANGPVYNFGAGGVTGDLTPGSLSFEAALPDGPGFQNVSLDVIGLFTAAGVGSQVFVDDNGVPRISQTSACCGTTFTGAGSLVTFTGGTQTFDALSIITGGDQTVTTSAGGSALANTLELGSEMSLVVQAPLSVVSGANIFGSSTLTIDNSVNAFTTTLTSFGDLTINAPVIATIISAQSSDIALNAQLGDSATELTTLRTFNGQLGGVDPGDRWFLDQTELNRLSTAQLVIRADNDLTVDSIDIPGSLSSTPILHSLSGISPSLTLAASHVLTVTGALRLLDGADDRLGLLGQALLRVDTTTGSVSNPNGWLYLRGDRIEVASTNTLTNVGNQSDAFGRNAVLRDSQDVANAGVLTGARVSLRAGTRAWVANTGDSVTYAGILAGDQGVDLDAREAASFSDNELGNLDLLDSIGTSVNTPAAEFIIYGQQVVGGVPVTGDDFFNNSVTYDLEGVTSQSYINNCSVVDGCPVPPPPPPADTGFKGDYVVTAGQVSVSRGSNIDNFTVTGANGGVADLTWTPYDNAGVGTIDFLPSANSGFFVGESGLGSFTVINRVLPADPLRPIALNGLVTSTLFDGSPGGTILFYAPGGIVIGSTARLDVGSLLLTTLSPTRLAEGSFQLAGIDGSGAAVDVNAGAVLTAQANGGYVALAAPRVTMSGTVSVDGTAAYVAAEAVDLNISAGVYDIAVTAGTDTGSAANANPNAIVHDGQTVVRGDSSVAQRVVMTAVSKNDAITMMVGGSVVGSLANPADNVFVDGSDIVLSSGFPGTAGGGAITVPQDSQVNPNQTADLVVSASALALPLAAEAQSSASISIIGASASYASVSLLGRQTSLIRVGGSVPSAASTLSISGDLVIDGGGVGAGRVATIAIGPSSLLDLFGNDLRVDLTGRGSVAAANATGGTVNFNVSGGQINANTVTLRADGVGYDTGDTVPGGSGRGGTVKINGQAASLALSGDLLVSADGTGFGIDPVAGTGGGYGGSASISMTGGSLNAGAVSVSANAASAGLGDPELAPAGLAGTATIDFSGVSGSTVGSLTVDASFTGSGTRGRSGSGGNAALGITADLGAAINVTGDVLVRADVRGGDAVLGPGGAAVAGIASLTLSEDRLLLNAPGAGPLQRLTVSADAVGGLAAGGSNHAGGAATAGRATISVGLGGVLGGTATDTRTPVILVSASASGGGSDSDGGNGGNATAGEAQILVTTQTGSVAPSRIGADEIRVVADALGGQGGDIGPGGQAGAGGAAVGGLARLSVDGQINLLTEGSSSSVQLSAAAFGGNGGAIRNSLGLGAGEQAGAGGTANGGRAELLVADNGSIGTSGLFPFSLVGITADTSAFGGDGGSAEDNPLAAGAAGGAGGAGAAGTTAVQINGTLAQAGSDRFDLTLTAAGAGGDGGSGGQGTTLTSGGAGGAGGGATSGEVTLAVVSAGVVTVDDMLLQTTSVGGAGGLAGIGGTGGDGGSVTLAPAVPAVTLAALASGRLTAGTITVNARAAGGAGGGTAAGANDGQTPGPGGAGGGAVAGELLLTVDPAATLSLTGQLPVPDVGLLRAMAIELGASGGLGGDGFAPGVGFSGSAGGAGGTATGGIFNAVFAGTVSGAGIAVSLGVQGGNGGAGGAAGFNGDPAVTGGAGGNGGAAGGGGVDITFADTAVVSLDNLEVSGGQVGGTGGNGGAAPDPANPDFIAGVGSFGPGAYDFGLPGNGGDVTFSSISLQSALDGLALDGLRIVDITSPAPGGSGFVATDGPSGPGIASVSGASGGVGGPASTLQLDGRLNASSVLVAVGGTLNIIGANGLATQNAQLTSSYAGVNLATPIDASSGLTVFGLVVTIDAAVTGDEVSTSAQQTVINAAVDGRIITIQSEAIDLAATIGSATTADLTFNIINPFSPAYLGGADPGPGVWYLSQADAGLLRAERLLFRAVGSLEVGDLTLFGAGATQPTLNTLPTAATPSVVIAADSAINVTGQLQLLEAGGADLGLVSAGTLRVDPTAGGRIVADGGNLYLRGADIEVADSLTLAAVRSQVDASGRNAVLRAAPSAPATDVLVGDRVTLRAAGHAWLANSGPGPDFSGILTGAGGLDIDGRDTIGAGQVTANITAIDGIGTDADLAEFIGFGRQLVGGVFTTNDAFFTNALTSGSNVSSDSFINNCSLLTGCPLPPVDVAFQGDYTVDAGSLVSVDRGNFTDRFTIGGANNATVVLTWSPYDVNGVGTIDFLPGGNSGQFVGDVGLTDFTVINRVLPVDPTRRIALNGLVTSRLDDGSVGGRVLFFAPGGVIIGSTASLDVGSLFLSAADPVLQADGVTWRFDGASGDSLVAVDAGASITASGAAVLVAPQLRMDGAITVGGTAAYIAANDVDVRLDAATGNYDIGWGSSLNLPSGTTAISVSGTTTSDGSATSGLVIAAPTAFQDYNLDVGGAILGSFGRSSNVYSTQGVFDPGGSFSIRPRSGAALSGFVEGQLTLRPSQVDSTLFFGAGAVTITPNAAGSVYLGTLGGSGSGRLDIITQNGVDLLFNGPASLGTFPTAGRPVTVSGDGTLGAASSLFIDATGDLTVSAPIVSVGSVNLRGNGVVSVTAPITSVALGVEAIGSGARIDVGADLSGSLGGVALTAAGGDINVGVALSNDSPITISAGLGVTALDITSNSSVTLGGTTITAGAVSGSDITVTGTGSGGFTFDTITASGGLTMSAATQIAVGPSITAASIDISSPLTSAGLTVRSPVTGAGNFSFASLSIDGTLDIAGGALTTITGPVSAGRIVVGSSGALAVTDLASNDLIDLTAEGQVNVTGTVSGGTLTVTTNAGANDPSFDVALNGGLSLTNLNVGAGGSLTVAQPLDLAGNASINALAANMQSVTAAGDVTIVTSTVGTGTTITGGLDAAAIFLSGGPVSISGGVTGTSIGVEASGAVGFGADATASGAVSITAGGPITLSGTTSGASLTLSGQSLDLAGLLADPGDNITITGTGGAVALNGPVSAGVLTITAADAPVTIAGSADVTGLSVTTSGSGADIIVTAPFTIVSGNTALFNSAGAITITSDLDLAGVLDLTTTDATNGDISLGAVTSQLTFIEGAGTLTVGGPVATGFLRANVAGSQSYGGDLLGDFAGVSLTGGGPVTVAGAIDTVGRALIQVDGNVTISGPVSALGNFGEIALASGTGSVAAGSDLVTSGAVVLTAAGGLTVAGDSQGTTITASGATLQLGGLGASAGGITATAAAGAATFDGAITGTALTAQATGGAVTLNGAVDVGALSVQALGSGAAIVINAPITIPTGVEGQFFAQGPITASVDLATAGALRFGTSVAGNPVLGTVSLAGVSSGGLTIQASGAVSLTGALVADGVFIENGGSQSFGGGITTNGLSLFGAGPVSVTGGIASGRTIIAVDGAIAVSGGILADGRGGATSEILLGNTAGDITVGGGLTTGRIAVTAGNGGVAVGGVVDASSFDVTANSLSLAQQLTLSGAANLTVDSLSLTGPVSVGSLTASGDGSGDFDLDSSLTASGAVSLTGGQAITIVGPVVAGSILLSAATLGFGDLQANGTIDLTSGASLLLSGTISATNLDLLSTAGGVTLAGAPTLTGRLDISASGDVSASAPLTAPAGLAILANGGDILLAGVNSTGLANLTASGAVDIVGGIGAGSLSISAGTDIAVGGAINLTGVANLGAGGSIVLAGLTAGTTTLGAGSDISFGSAVSISGNFDAGAGGSFGAAGALQVAGLTTIGTGGDIALDAGLGASAADLVADGTVTISLGAAVTNDFVINGVGSVVVGGGLTAGALDLTSVAGSGTGAIDLTGPTVVTGTMTVSAEGDVTTAGITAGVLDITAGNLTTGALLVDDAILSAGAITLGSVTGNSLSLSANGGITLGGAVTLTDALAVLKSTGMLASAPITANSLSVVSTGSASLGDLDIANGATLDIGGDLVAGAVTVGSLDATLGAGADLVSLASGGTIAITTTAPIIIAGGLAGTAVTLLAATDAGSIAIGGATDVESLNAIANGDISLADVTSTGLLSLSTGARLSAGAVDAGLLAATATDGATLGSLTTAAAANLSSIGAIAVTTDLAAGGAVNLTGSTVTVGGLASGNSLVATGGNLSFGALAITNAAVLDASGLLGVSGTTATGALTASGASVTLHDLSISGTADIASNAGLTILAGGLIADSVTLTAGTDLTVGGPLAAADLDVTAGGASFGRLDIGGALSVLAGGDVGFTGPVTTGTLEVLAGGDVSAGTINATGNATILGASLAIDRVDAASVDIDSLGDASLAAIAGTGDVSILVEGAITLGSVAAGTLSLTTTDSAVPLAVTSLAVAGTATLRSANTLTIGGGSAGTLDAATSAGDLTLAGSFTAGIQADLAATGRVTIGGSLASPTIAISGSDVLIGTTAALGGPATTAIRFVANANAGSVDVGGAVGSGFALDAAELTRLRANDISVDAGNRAMAVHDLTLAGSAAASPNLNGSLFELVSAGDIRIDGAIAITDAGLDDTIRIAAGGLLQVVRPTGSLSVTDANGALAGLIDLSAGNRVLVASDSARTAIDAATSVDARRAVLIANDGPVVSQGVVRADGVTLAAGNAIQVQNSAGAGGTPAGIASGGRGLTLARPGNAAPGAVEVIGYGAGTFAGQPLTGFAYAETVQFTPGTLATGSQINNCILGAPCRGSFQGDPTIEQGSVSFVRSEFLDTVTVNSGTAVLRWTPYDDNGVGTIDFLPQANSGLFRGSSDFVVINRILPSDPNRPVAINGSITSQILGQAGPATGGTLVFYAPGGVLLGGTARLDVGSLLLSAADVGFSNGVFSLDAAADSQTQVGIDAGAVVNALNEGSFVALFGPRVRADGAINVAGTAAFVAAEAGDLRFNVDSTFDVSIRRGTLLPNVDLQFGAPTVVLDIDGSVGGPVAGAGGGRTLVAAVAARTGRGRMLVGGDLGWSNGAGARDSQLLLAAGADAVGASGRVTMPGDLGGVADVLLISGTSPTVIRSDVIAEASRSVIVQGTVAGVSLLGDLTSRSAFGTSFGLTGIAGATIAVAGDVTATTRPGDLIGRSLFQLLADAPGGSIAIGGNVTANAPSLTLAQGVTVAGGNALLSAAGGSLTIAGDVSLNASGAGGGPGGAQPGQGGQALVEAFNGGSIAIGGALSLVALGIGSDIGAPGVIRGGTAGSLVDGGSVSARSLFIDVSAIGSASAPDATGGVVEVGSLRIGDVNDFGDITILATATGPGANRGGSVETGAGETGSFFVRAGDLTIFGAGLTSTVASVDIGVDGDISIAPDVIVTGTARLEAGGRIAIADLSAATVSVSAAGSITAGAISGGAAQVESISDGITLAGANVTGRLDLAAGTDVSVIGALTAGSLAVNAGGSVGLAGLTVTGDADIAAATTLALGQGASIGGLATLTAGVAADIGPLTANTLLLTATAGALNVSGPIVVTDAASLSAGGALTATTIAADRLDLDAGAAVTLAGLQIAGDATIAAGTDLLLTGSASIGGAAGLSAGGDLTLAGDLDAASLTAGSSGASRFANLVIGNGATVTAGSDLIISGDVAAAVLSATATAGRLAVAGGIDADTIDLGAGTSLAVTGPVATTQLLAVAGADVTLGRVASTGLVDLASGGGVLLGDDLVAATLAAVATGGGITGAGALTAASLNLDAVGAVALTRVGTSGDATLTAGTSLGISDRASIGGLLTLTAGADIAVGVDLTAAGLSASSIGAARFANIASTGAVAVASGSDLVITGGVNATALDLTAGSGALSVTGDVVATRAGLVSGTDLTITGTIAADSLVADAGGSLDLRGVAATGAVAATAGSGMTMTSLSGSGLSLSAGGPVLLGPVTGSALTIAATGPNGRVTLDTVRLTGRFGIASSGDVDAADALVVDSLGVDAGGRVALLALSASDARIATGGRLDLAGATSIGGALDLVAGGSLLAEGAITAGSLTASAFDAAFNAPVAVIGAVVVDTDAALRFVALDAGSMNLTSRTNMVMLSDDAAVGGDAAITAGGDVAVAGALTAASLDIGSSGDVDLAAVTVSGALDVRGTAVGLGGAVQADTLGIEATSLDVDATLSIARGATITTSGAVTSTAMLAAQDLVLDAAGPLTFDALEVASADLTTQGSFTVVGATTITNALRVNAVGSVDFAGRVIAASVNIDSDAAVTAAAGIATTGATSISGASASLGPVSAASLSANTIGPLQLAGPVNAGTVNLTATGAQGRIAIDGAIIASTSFAADASRQVTVSAAVQAPTIAINAADLVIGTSGSLGGAQTSSITLATSAAKASSATVGGAGGAGGFEIDANELLRLRADSILIDTGFGSGGPSLTIAGFTVQGPSAAQPNLNTSDLTIASGGDLTVAGLAAIDNAGSADVLSLLASGDIRVLVENGGGALVRDSNGALTGQLYLLGQRILAARSDGLGFIDANATGELLRSALAFNSGAIVPEGYLQAGRISMRANTDILMQNSGGNAVYAGLTVGSGGFDIRQGSIGQRQPGLGLTPASLDQRLTSNGQVRVIAFGRQVANGQTLVNAQFLPVVQVSVSAVATESEIDGCNLATGVCRSPLADGDPMTRIETLTDAIVRPAMDTVMGVAESDDGDPGDSPTGHPDDDEAPDPLPIMETRIVDPLAPVITGDIPEPAGGVGNDAVWSSEAGVNELLDAGTGVGNENNTVVTPGGGGRGGSNAALGGAGGGTTTNSVGSERNPGTSAAEQGNGGSSATGGPGGSGGGTSTNSVGSERNPGTTGAEQGTGGSATSVGPGGSGASGGTTSSVGSERNASAPDGSDERQGEPPRGER